MTTRNLLAQPPVIDRMARAVPCPGDPGRKDSLSGVGDTLILPRHGGDTGAEAATEEAGGLIAAIIERERGIIAGKKD